MCEIRIIRRVSAICSEILHFETVGGKPVDNRLLVGETCVIGADSNFSHYFFVNYSPPFVNHSGQGEKFFIIGVNGAKLPLYLSTTQWNAKYE
ncbi:hypothetical protein D3C86_2049260 [compost metagenome]